MKIWVTLFIMIFAVSANAGMKNSFLELSGGTPIEMSIENPDQSIAYYNGLTFKTQFNYSFSDNKDSLYGVNLGYKYLNIKNTKESSTTETGAHKGFGAGLFAKFSGLYLGVNYYLMNASHEAAGSMNAIDTFKYNSIAFEISYTVEYGSNLEIGPAYSYTTGDLTAEETGLSADAPYKEQILWFKLLFSL